MKSDKVKVVKKSGVDYVGAADKKKISTVKESSLELMRLMSFKTRESE